MKNILFSIVLLLGLVGCGGDQKNVADAVFPTHAIAGVRQSAPQKISTPTFGLRANYTITKTSAGYTVTDLIGSTGTQTLSLSATHIVFSDMTVNLGIGDKSKTISAANLQSLIELYIAYFNRVPDADGLSYWIDQLVSGQSLDQIGTSFYNAAIYYSSLTGYSASMTNAEFITVIYKNVLGRSSVDSGGMTYWSNGLANGSVTRGTLVGSILASAHTFKGDTTYGYVADLLDNKVQFANFFTIQQGLNYNTPEDSINNTMAMVAAITPTSTAAAVSMLNPICEQQTKSWGTSGKRSLNDKPWGWSQVETPIRLGKVSQRFEVRAGDCTGDIRWDDCAQDRERSEWVDDAHILPNSQKAISWSIYLDTEFKDSPIVKTTLGQLHQDAWFKNGPLLQFELWGGQYQMCIHRLSGNINNAIDKCEYWPLAKLSDMKGRWTDIRFYLDSSSQTGSLKVWVNEKVKADIKTPVVTWDPNYFYFKYGIYRSFVSRHGSPMPTQIAYFDEVRIANKISQVNLSCPLIPVD